MMFCHLSFLADGYESDLLTARNLSARSFLLIRSPTNPHRYAELVFSFFCFVFLFFFAVGL